MHLKNSSPISITRLNHWRSQLAQLFADHTSHTDHTIDRAVNRIIAQLLSLAIAQSLAIFDQHCLRQLIRHSIAGNILHSLEQLSAQLQIDLFSSAINFTNLSTDILKELDQQLCAIIADLDDGISEISPKLLMQFYEHTIGSRIQFDQTRVVTIINIYESKRAGGVFYTPCYIADYIVDLTLPRALPAQSPEQLHNLRDWRLLDPACGAGIFLTRAYQKLLDRFLAAYLQVENHINNPSLYQDEQGQLRLRLTEKQRILQLIEGFDIDIQAVEFAKLALIWQLCQGEQQQLLQLSVSERISLIAQLQRQLREQIVCRDALSEQLMTNYQSYDLILGNPPYLGFQLSTTSNKLKAQFHCAQGKFDYYTLFIEQALRLLRADGYLGFICPLNFAKRAYGQWLRHYLQSSTQLIEICDFQDRQIFTGAINYTATLIVQKSQPAIDQTFRYKRRDLADAGIEIAQSQLNRNGWQFPDRAIERLIMRLKQQTASLGQLTNGISEGIVTGKNSVFLITREMADAWQLESELLQPCLRGREIQRYRLKDCQQLLIYPYRLIDGRTMVLSPAMLSRYPNIWRYLNQAREQLAGRDYFDRSWKQWYELWCARDLRQQCAQKIVVAELAATNRFALADREIFYGDTVCGITLKSDMAESLKYLLAILNSQLMTNYYRYTTVPKLNGYYIYKTMFLKELPIRRIDFSQHQGRADYQQLIELVDQISQQNPSNNEAAQSDAALDDIIYRLYGLDQSDIDRLNNSWR